MGWWAGVEERRAECFRFKVQMPVAVMPCSAPRLVAWFSLSVFHSGCSRRDGGMRKMTRFASHPRAEGWNQVGALISRRQPHASRASKSRAYTSNASDWICSGFGAEAPLSPGRPAAPDMFADDCGWSSWELRGTTYSACAAWLRWGRRRGRSTAPQQPTVHR